MLKIRKSFAKRISEGKAKEKLVKILLLIQDKGNSNINKRDARRKLFRDNIASRNVVVFQQSKPNRYAY